MESDGTEETTLTRQLQQAIAEIDQLARWQEPREVVVRATLEEILTVKFKQLLIGIYGTGTDDDPHAFGKSGIFAISTYILALVINTEGLDHEVPGAIAGLTDSVGPSMAVVDGALRNGLHAHTLGVFVIAGMSELGPGQPIPVPEPEEAIARQWIFTAHKEVER
jgi:hypothetical protein